MQISLRGLLLFTAAVSVLCVVMFVAPPMWGVWIMAVATHLMLPPFLLAGLIYSYGPVRAFFLGATLSIALPVLVGAFYILSAMDGMDDGAQFTKFLYAIVWATAIISGLACTGIYRFVTAPVAAVEPITTLETEGGPCGE